MEPTITSKEWDSLDGELVLLNQFIPLAKVESNAIRTGGFRTPYAIVSITSPKDEKRTDLPISHRIDFLHLWEAFEVRKIKESEEVIICWSKNHHQGLKRLFSYFLPRIHVMICRKGSYGKMTEPSWVKNGAGVVQEWKPIKNGS